MHAEVYLLCCKRTTMASGRTASPPPLALQVCYSWWCLSCMSILGRLHWIDGEALARFILYCQVSCASYCGRLACSETCGATCLSAVSARPPNPIMWPSLQVKT